MRQRGGHHFVDQVLFGRRGRLVSGGEVILQFLEFIFVFVFEEDGVAGSKPWRRELREDFSFVSADLGPRDLAPLARAVSDFSCDGMWRSCI